MTGRIIKNNPSFLREHEVIVTFAAHKASFDLTLELIRGSAGEANKPLLIIGPRGGGKTMLLHRVAAAIRKTPEFDVQWFPIFFGEESYNACSVGEFWLEAVNIVGMRTGDAEWAMAYEELLKEPDDRRLGPLCLTRLLDFADNIGKRLLLVVENLNLVIGQQFSKQDARSLSDTLRSEPRLMLLGSAAPPYDFNTGRKNAVPEMFRVIELAPFSVEECQAVWNRIAGREISLDQARALRILTGGVPRFLTALAGFGENLSFQSLPEMLTLLVDDLTDYFKANFEKLPPTERKVFACLAALWEESLAGDAARAARMSTSKTSALLKRLEGRGAVKSVRGTGGKKRYQLAEPLFSIYHLMRGGRGRARVQALARFMAQFYGGERLPQKPKVISLRDINASSGHSGALVEGIKALYDRRWEEAVDSLRKAVELDPEDSLAWSVLGSVLIFDLRAKEEGTDCLGRAAALDPSTISTDYFLNKIMNGEASTTLIEAVLARTGWAASLLDNIARALMAGEQYEDLEAIEAWAGEAVEQKRDEPGYRATLARALALRGSITQAFEHAAFAFQDPEVIQEDIKGATDILTIAAALDYGREALDLAPATPVLAVLEPAAAGLKKYLGLEVHAPREVLEIGDDIIKRIEHWKEWHAWRVKS